MNANTDVGQLLVAMFRLPCGCSSCVKLSSERCTVVTEFTYRKSSFRERKKSQTSISIKGIRKGQCWIWFGLLHTFKISSIVKLDPNSKIEQVLISGLNCRRQKYDVGALIKHRRTQLRNLEDESKLLLKSISSSSYYTRRWDKQESKDSLGGRGGIWG